MSQDNDWKEILALAALLFAVSISWSTCKYVEHRIDLEKPATMEKKP